MPHDFKDVPLDKLSLDERNPRLPESLPRDQQSMIDYIADTTAIEELMGAIAENNFFPGEPLIAVPNPAVADTYIVVEGNRRLTALLLIQDPTRTAHPSSRMKEIGQDAKHKPTSIPVVECPSRDDVLPYLGFRHITGVKQWEPLAKARYIEQLFRLTDPGLAPSERYADVARAIGSRRDHIKRNLDALAVYRVIKGADFYEVPELSEDSIKFAVLSTALADSRIGRFVGLNENAGEGNEFVPNEPIVDSSRLKGEGIKELTKWLYEKDAKGATKVGESRNLRMLSAVVSNERALAAFRGGTLLKIAYQITSDVVQDFMGLLYQAENALSEASGMVATVQYSEDAMQVARRVRDHSGLIVRELIAKTVHDDDL